MKIYPFCRSLSCQFELVVNEKKLVDLMICHFDFNKRVEESNQIICGFTCINNTYSCCQCNEKYKEQTNEKP